MGDILCLYDQFWSNFRYFIDLSGTRTQIMATEDEDLSASVIFLGIFLGNGRVFFDEFFSKLRGLRFKQLNF